MGSIINTELAKAFRSSTFAHTVSRGISSIPPPAPKNPLAVPAAAPDRAHFHLFINSIASTDIFIGRGDFILLYGLADQRHYYITGKHHARTTGHPGSAGRNASSSRRRFFKRQRFSGRFCTVKHTVVDYSTVAQSFSYDSCQRTEFRLGNICKDKLCRT